MKASQLSLRNGIKILWIKKLLNAFPLNKSWIYSKRHETINRLYFHYQFDKKLLFTVSYKIFSFLKLKPIRTFLQLNSD